MTQYPDFSQLLAGHLHEADRSLTWLARQLEMNVSSISRWFNEDTRPGSAKKIYAIAEALQLSTQQCDKLLGAAGYPMMEPIASPTPTRPLATTASNLSTLPKPYLVPAMPPQGIFGRTAMLEKIVSQLTNLDHHEFENTPLALQGMGGIGKTTLAVALGHSSQVRRSFPDGILWTAVGPQPTIRQLLERWGSALGLHLFGERNEEACQERLRSMLAEKRILLLVDDLWDAKQGAHFLVGGPHCRTVITTRELPVAHLLATRGRTLQIDVLQPADAIAMLQKLVPEIRNCRHQTVDQLCRRLEYLPLALNLAGRLLADVADVPSHMERLLGELVERRAARLQLLKQEGRLGVNEEQPVSLQAILGMSIERLSIMDQARFAMLSVFGAEPLTWQLDAAAYIWQCSAAEAEATSVRLLQRGIVTHRQSAYWMHALLADYAAELCQDMGL